MNKETFELELVQLEELFSKSRSNKFSDPRKNEFYSQLFDTFSAIVNSDYDNFTQEDRVEHLQIIFFLFNGLEFLETSTLNIIPFELVYCLGESLKDWVQEEDLIIVTSLSNRKSDISFQSINEELLRNVKQLISDKYGIKIKHRLIRITLPKSLSRDYLAGVALYHELGHFVDSELKVSERIFFKKYLKPHYLMNTVDENTFFNHTKEYFADLFAAQYVNDASTCYVNHVAYNSKGSLSHPSSKNRETVVKGFLYGNENTGFLSAIQEALEKIGKEKFKIRHELIGVENSDFSSLIPQDILNIPQLHGIMKLGWDFWLGKEKNFLSSFSRRQRYYVLNNLIEKSISNYYVVQSWKEIKEKDNE